MSNLLNLRRAIFVYEAARLEAEISKRRIVPEPWHDFDRDSQATGV